MPFFKSKQKRGNMQRLGVIFISVGIAGVLLFSGLMLMMNTASQGDMQHPHVVCTTGIVADTVSRVAGEHVRVTHLMGPGVDPHVYRARESDMHRLASADIIFYNGLHLEGKMDDVFAQMERYTKTVAVTDAIPREKLRPSPFAGLYDPHVWFDVRIWMYTVDVIEQVLADTFPAYAQDFTENARYYRDQLAQLDQYVRDAVAMLAPEQRRLVTAHDAFGYFARAYDFDVVGLQGISTDSQVSTYDIQQLANYIVRHKVATIFTEASIPERNIQAVQQAAAAQGHNVRIGDQLYSDTLGPPRSDAASYIDMVRYNVQTIVQALQQSG